MLRRWTFRARWYSRLLAVVLTSGGSYLLILVVHSEELAWTAPALWAFLIGMAYTHLFEYGYHRLVMHRGFSGLDFLRRRHREHHQIFHGSNFRAKKLDDLRHLSSDWYLFPLAFFLHYLAARCVATPPVLIAFFGGVVLHYLCFEISHWLTHVDDNLPDRLLGAIPLLNRVRERQICHHRMHHEIPEVDFNFNPPFAGDALWGTLAGPGGEAQIGVCGKSAPPVTA